MRGARALLLLGLLAVTAKAEVRLVAPRSAGPLAGGSDTLFTVEGLPPGTDEFELFLVPEPGARPLRLTESVAGENVVLLHVPNLTVAGARLLLRIGEEGEERWTAETEAFDIEASPLAPAASVSERFGEEWLLSADALARSVLGPAPRERWTEREGEAGLLRPSLPGAEPSFGPEPPATGEPFLTHPTGRDPGHDTGAFLIPLRR